MPPIDLTRPWLRAVLALLAGAAMPLAFAPFGWFPVAVLSLAVLFHLWSRATPRTAFALGWLFGLGLFGVGVSWINTSIGLFGGIGPALIVVITVLFVGAAAVYPGLAGWLSVRFGGPTDGVRLLLVYPALWGLVEWLRGWFLTGFPWLAAGYAQIDSPLAGLAPLLGVYGVGWAVAFSAGGLVYGLRANGRPRWLTLAALVLLWLGAAGLGQIHWTEPAGDSVRVSLVQGNIAQDMKWQSWERQRTLDIYAGLTRSHWDSGLIIWPETAVPAFFDQVEAEFLVPLAEEAGQHHTELLIGVPYQDPRSGAYFNSMLALGSEPGIYHKRHLVPFAEYVPLPKLFGPLMALFQIPMSDFSSGGSARPLLTVAGHAIGLSVCYEDAFGEEMIEALPEAAWLMNASNDAWFGDSLAPHQHLEIARMRSRETGRWMMRATNTGVSALIDDHGRVVARSPLFEPDVVTGEVRPMRGMTPYARYGNGLAVVVMLVMLLIASVRSRAGVAPPARGSG